MTITCVDLFCGCGGMSAGFMKAGIHISCAMDNWNQCLEVYQDNFSHDSILQNLSDVSQSVAIVQQYAPEMIIGGPPCQDFSSAGKRDESLGRADLTLDFTNIVCQVLPQYFVMENVERIKKSPILQTIIEQYELHGYGLTPVVLDAAYCNTPQARKRFFLIGVLGAPHHAVRSILHKNLAPVPMTIRDYMGDELGLQYYYRHPRNYSRRGIFSIDEPSPTVRGVNRPIPPGYKKHPGDPQAAELSDIRPLSTIERSYLQTFPKNFRFNAPKTHLEQMIGNAVPVNLAAFVANAILEYEATKDSIEESQLQMFHEMSASVVDEKQLLLKPII